MDVTTFKLCTWRTMENAAKILSNINFVKYQIMSFVHVYYQNVRILFLRIALD